MLNDKTLKTKFDEFDAVFEDLSEEVRTTLKDAWSKEQAFGSVTKTHYPAPVVRLGQGISKLIKQVNNTPNPAQN